MRYRVRSGEPNRTDGFSLLEALAALLVISVALIPLFQMQSALSDASRRAQLQAERVLGSVDVVAFFNTLNPMLQPRGDQVFDGITLSWTSSEIERIERASALQPQSETVALFLVEITIDDFKGRRILSESIYLVGWTEPQRRQVLD